MALTLSREVLLEHNGRNHRRWMLWSMILVTSVLCRSRDGMWIPYWTYVSAAFQTVLSSTAAGRTSCRAAVEAHRKKRVQLSLSSSATEMTLLTLAVVCVLVRLGVERPERLRNSLSLSKSNLNTTSAFILAIPKASFSRG